MIINPDLIKVEDIVEEDNLNTDSEDSIKVYKDPQPDVWIQYLDNFGTLVIKFSEDMLNWDDLTLLTTVIDKSKRRL